MLVVGLTGGIASGKTLAAKQFAELGVEIIDTDLIAREIVAPHTITQQKIVEYFGTDILQADQQINRQKLRELIFLDPEKKVWLEALLHPQIRRITQQKIATVTTPYCIVVIPLLFETWPNPLINRVLVIDCLKSVQLERLIQRDHIKSELAEAMLDAQATRENRLSIADDAIENNSTCEGLQESVLKMHHFYTQLTRSTL